MTAMPSDKADKEILSAHKWRFSAQASHAKHRYPMTFSPELIPIGLSDQ